LGRLVLVRACCRCLSLGGPTLCGLGFGCLVLGCLVLGGLTLSRLVLSCFIFVCFVRCARLFGRYHSGAAELPRLRSCSDSRPALVHGRQECMVGAGSVHMLGLQRCW